MKNTLKYALAGAAAGAVNGMFGAGGGMVLVPLFLRWVRLDGRRALATAVAMILPLSAISATVVWFRAGLDIRGALPYLLGGLIGGFIGGRVFKKVPPALMHRLLGLFILFGGIRSILC